MPKLGKRLKVRATGEPIEFVGYTQTRLRCRHMSGEVRTYAASEVMRPGRPRLYSDEQRVIRKRQLARERYAKKVLAIT